VLQASVNPALNIKRHYCESLMKQYDRFFLYNNLILEISNDSEHNRCYSCWIICFICRPHS